MVKGGSVRYAGGELAPCSPSASASSGSAGCPEPAALPPGRKRAGSALLLKPGVHCPFYLHLSSCAGGRVGGVGTAPGSRNVCVLMDRLGHFFRVFLHEHVLAWPVLLRDE